MHHIATWKSIVSLSKLFRLEESSSYRNDRVESGKADDEDASTLAVTMERLADSNPSTATIYKGAYDSGRGTGDEPPGDVIPARPLSSPSLPPPSVSLSLSLSLSLSVVTTRCSPAIIPAVRFNSVFLTDVLRIFRRRFYRTGHRRQIRHCYASWIIDLFSQEWAITYSAVSFPAVHYLLSAIPIIIIPI